MNLSSDEALELSFFGNWNLLEDVVAETNDIFSDIVRRIKIGLAMSYAAVNGKQVKQRSRELPFLLKTFLPVLSTFCILGVCGISFICLRSGVKSG